MNTRAHYMKFLLTAIQDAHSKDILHQNVNPSSMYFNDDLKPLITGWGEFKDPKEFGILHHHPVHLLRDDYESSTQ